MTSRSDRLKAEDSAGGVECSFDLADALPYEKTHGITTKVSIGISRDPENRGLHVPIRYAVCPICYRQGGGFGMYHTLQDAVSCADGHTIVDPGENAREKRLILDREKAHNVFLHSTMLMHKRYAIVSKSRTLAENFVRDTGIEAVMLHSIDDLIRVSDHQFLFLGRPTNYLTHPVLEDQAVRKELERQECVRDWNYGVFDGKKILLSDKYDLEDLEGELWVRKQVRGHPAYVKTSRSIVHNPPK